VDDPSFGSQRGACLGVERYPTRPERRSPGGGITMVCASLYCFCSPLHLAHSLASLPGPSPSHASRRPSQQYTQLPHILADEEHLPVNLPPTAAAICLQAHIGVGILSLELFDASLLFDVFPLRRAVRTSSALRCHERLGDNPEALGAVEAGFVPRWRTAWGSGSRTGRETGRRWGSAWGVGVGGAASPTSPLLNASPGKRLCSPRTSNRPARPHCPCLRVPPIRRGSSHWAWCEAGYTWMRLQGYEAARAYFRNDNDNGAWRKRGSGSGQRWESDGLMDHAAYKHIYARTGPRIWKYMKSW
ncbi:hypothetical protein K438DRAFT_2074438, partial [Mycena galopus ATCC 62051]